jgi:hypothetical protein
VVSEKQLDEAFMAGVCVALAVLAAADQETLWRALFQKSSTLHAHDTEYAAKAIAQKYNRPLPKKEAPAADIDLDGDDDTWKPMTVKALKKK